MKKFFTVCMLVFFANAFQVHAQDWPVLKLNAGAHERRPGPVFIPVPKEWKAGKVYQLENTRTRKKYALQQITATELAFILTDTLRKGQTESYRFVPGKKEKSLLVVAEKTDSGILVKNGNKPVLFYHSSEKYPGGDTASVYKRSGFIHPLYTPGGKILTDDFPVGHTHQHAVFFAWVNTVFKREKTDFWNQHQLTGTVKHLAVEEVVSGPVCTQLKLRLGEMSNKHGIVLEEKWELRIYSLPDVFLFDIHIDQTNVTNDTLFLPQYIYGGMALRGSREWNEEDKAHFKEKWKVKNAEGKENEAANHVPARWIQATGTGSADNGVVVYDHPKNLRYPQPVRVHLTMPYFVFSPVVQEGFHLPPAGKYKAQYRFMTYGMDPGKNRVLKEEQNWVAPPEVDLSY